MKALFKSLAVAAAGAVVLYAIGIPVAGAGTSPKADKPCPGCPQASADRPAAPPMMEKMKAHLEGMKSAVAALRESEKALAGTEDPKAFRAAVIGHLKTLDDLQASHLTHMESMMGRMHDGKPGMDCGRCPDCKCGECRCKDCMPKDDCCCKGDGPPGGSHSH
jgi:hypothetical protein